MSDEITLYFSPLSRAFIALWMLEEIGRPHRIQTIDFAKDERKSPEYLAADPMGKVPAVVVDGVVVTESQRSVAGGYP